MWDLARRIHAHAAENGGLTAVAHLQEPITYAALAATVARIANHLVDNGVKRGAKVFLNGTSPDLRLAFNAACMHHGIVPIMVLDPATLKGALVPDVWVGTSEPFDEALKSDIHIDRKVLAGAVVDHRLRAADEPDDDDLLMITSTSGTTGRRKVIASSAGAFRRVEAKRRARLDRGARLMFTVGDLTRYGITASYRILANGGTLVRHPTDAITCIRAINLFRVTDLYTTPKRAEALADAMIALGALSPSVRRINLTGSLIGETLPEKIERTFVAAEASVAYGASEVGGISRGRITAATFRRGYVGEMDQGISIVTTGTREAPGQLNVVRLDKVFTDSFVNGRLVRNEETFYNIPDLGYVEGTSIFLQGRADEAFNFSGVIRAYGLIEDEVRKLPGVRDVGIVGLRALGEPEAIAVGIVTDAPLDGRDAARQVARGLGLPSAADAIRVFTCRQIVRNDMGKVDRSALTETYRDSRRDAAEPS